MCKKVCRFHLDLLMTHHGCYPHYFSSRFTSGPFHSQSVPTQNVVPRIKKEARERESELRSKHARTLELDTELPGPKLWKRKPGLAGPNTNMPPACADGLCYCHSAVPPRTAVNSKTVARETTALLAGVVVVLQRTKMNKQELFLAIVLNRNYKKCHYVR